ncbi:MAG: transposase domain-containing protein, partial [Gammaproteobacteria bacterium]
MSIEAVHPATAINALIAQKDAEIARLSAHLKVLQEQINLLTAKRFGPSSEKVHPDQFRLFNEAELEAVAPLEDEQATIEIPAHRRRPGGRKPLPPQLPRIEIVHDLAEEEKICPHDGVVLRGGLGNSDRSLSGWTAIFSDDSRRKSDETTPTQSLTGIQGA